MNKSLTLTRKSNFLIAARKFNIFIDDKLTTTIKNGERIEIPITENAKSLYIKILNNYSSSIDLTKEENFSYEVSQNIIPTVSSIMTVLIACIFLFLKFVLNLDVDRLLLYATPTILISTYFATYGRREIVQLCKV